MPKSRVIVLAGPTAVGKTAISLKLARELGCEIISADSMQIYKGMDIGTAKITKEEMGDIRHHLIDVVNPGENFDVFQYQEMAKNKIQEIISRGNIPLITGGTGFYIQALLYDINFTEESSDKSYRSELQELVDTGRGQELYEKLLCVDKEYAGTVHPNNYKRIIRALDYYNNTGEKFSSHNEEQSKN
ncbi:MAG: tRNA (adenosine(37)-N6)-dimethylallyltransferase MiaA, partial [Eubacterium sp.]|nr:tRNA (adenosine(37)-N6)-dimethylallyltransferase MiaA [Eubacterium sp.]